MKRFLYLFLMIGTFAWSFQVGLISAAQSAENWQVQKTQYNQAMIDSKINPVCYPVDARTTVDPHNCFLEQFSCAKDNSGYGKCVTKNCRWAQALDGPEEDAQPLIPTIWMWYCDPIWDPTGATAPKAAPMPPPECSTLQAAWSHRLSTHPACQTP